MGALKNLVTDVSAVREEILEQLYNTLNTLEAARRTANDEQYVITIQGLSVYAKWRNAAPIPGTCRLVHANKANILPFDQASKYAASFVNGNGHRGTVQNYKRALENAIVDVAQAITTIIKNAG